MKEAQPDIRQGLTGSRIRSGPVFAVTLRKGRMKRAAKEKGGALIDT